MLPSAAPPPPPPASAQIVTPCRVAFSVTGGNDAAIRWAERDIVVTLSWATGTSPTLDTLQIPVESPAWMMIRTPAGDGNALAMACRDTSPELEGFRIDSRTDEALLIRAGNVPALVAGIYWYLESVRVDPSCVLRLEADRRPSFRYRMVAPEFTSFNIDPRNQHKGLSDLSALKALAAGYNLALGEASVTRAATWRWVDPGLLPEGSAARRAVDSRREALREFVDTARRFHLEPVAGGDEFEFPSNILNRPYAGELTEDGYTSAELKQTFGAGRIFCFARPKLWEMYRAKYDEALTDFPGLGAVLVRLGENYSHLTGGEYVGTGVYARDLSRYCPLCRDIPYDERIATVIERTREITAGEHRRLYIHRTWDTEFDRFHADPARYRAITQRLKSTDGLILSTKYSLNDFWMRSALNPTFGLDGIARMAEFQCTREYEGKGGYPAWMGREYTRAYGYVRDRGAVGVWNWHHGGGWGGPFVKCDLWNDANIFLVDHLMWEPDADPNALALRWAALRFGPAAAPDMGRVLERSEEAVEKFRYFQCYGEADKRSIPSHGWTRDDIVRGHDWLRRVYGDHPEAVDGLIAEKQEAVAILDEMIGIVEKRRRDIEAWAGPPSLSFEDRFPRGKALVEFTLDTLRYERHLAAAVGELVAAELLYLRWLENPKEGSAKATILKAVASAEANWSLHQELARTSRWAASPYRDDGMGETLRRIRREVAQGPEP